MSLVILKHITTIKAPREYLIGLCVGPHDCFSVFSVLGEGTSRWDVAGPADNPP